MESFPHKTRIWIETLVTFGNMGGYDLDEANVVRSPYNVEFPTTTHIIVCIYM